MALSRASFPGDFVWGTATAAYQVEGATSEDGRGPSVWDAFVQRPGAIADGQTGDIADDHYHRYPQDIALMEALGVNAYRFSISWPRIQPSGTGPANRAGIDHYRRVAEAVLERGIAPYVTLYHWDLPQALEDRGGWLERDTAERFAEYAEHVVDGLGDLVSNWITLNEPHAAAFAGYDSGVHAPGKKLGRGAGARAAHHLLLGHGRALEYLRATRPDHQVGITFDIWPIRPASDDASDHEAARRMDGPQNRFFLDAVLSGGYPEDALRELGEEEWFAGNPRSDADAIGAPIDFMGINFYGTHTVTLEAADDGSRNVVVIDTGAPRTQMGWPIEPEGLIDALEMAHSRQPDLPLYITENGSAYEDRVAPDGTVHDAERMRYLQDHLAACAEGLTRGLPLKGYFAWTLMDNFEWQFGYSRRFGLVHVDYETQERTMKDSGRWFSGFLNGQAS